MTVLKNKDIRIKRVHQCFSCLRVFPKDTVMHYQTIVDSHRFFSSYSCNTCRELFKFFKEEEYDWGFIEAELERGQTPEDLLEIVKKNKK